jgi:hypothetical protein
MYTNTVFNADNIIKESQNILQKSLETNPDFNISFKETQTILEKFLGPFNLLAFGISRFLSKMSYLY